MAYNDSRSSRGTQQSKSGIPSRRNSRPRDINRMAEWNEQRISSRWDERVEVELKEKEARERISFRQNNQNNNQRSF